MGELGRWLIGSSPDVDLRELEYMIQTFPGLGPPTVTSSPYLGLLHRASATLLPRAHLFHVSMTFRQEIIFQLIV